MIHPGQHRLSRIQLVNWGTFNGSFDLPVPRSGLVVTGPSGSGKSSLLDALSAVLVQPRWLAFNAAAQESGAGDRSRSLVTYIRGAHKREADQDSGQVATSYLRPGATWSGIALTFDDGLGALTTLVRLLRLDRGTNAPGDVASQFLVAEEAVELMDLKRFVEFGFEPRRLKAAHPDWFVSPTYSAFAVRLQRRLGLASDQAQRLLHKTQSAKNLTSLDTLLRDFMLDEPDTFRLVDEAQDQFEELSAAHASVVDARRQVERLTPLRDLHRERERLQARQVGLQGESAHLETRRLALHVARATRELARLESSLAGLRDEVRRAEAEVDRRQSDRDAAQRAVDGLGGRELLSLEAETERVRAERERRGQARDRHAAVARQAGLDLPTSPAELAAFGERLAAVEQELTETDEQREARYRLSGVHADARRRAETLDRELKSLDQQGSAIEAGLLAVRDQIAGAAGVSRDRLPFAGELIEVKPAEAAWTGAIERVLRSFARTLLVPDDLYPAVSQAVDAAHLGLRLVYERAASRGAVAAGPAARAGVTTSAATSGVDKRLATPGPAAPLVEDARSLVHKVSVTASPVSAWVEEQLASRFDYALVETAAELRAVRRGATRAGQIRHSATRHEKDDRRRVDDRRQWVLGSSGGAKREALVAALAAARAEATEAEAARDVAERGHSERSRLAQHLESLRDLTWDDIDVAGADAALAALAERADAVRAGNAGLAAAEEALDRAERLLAAAKTTLADWHDRRGRVAGQRDDLAGRKAGWEAEAAGREEVPEEVGAALDARFAGLAGTKIAVRGPVSAHAAPDNRATGLAPTTPDSHATGPAPTTPDSHATGPADTTPDSRATGLADTAHDDGWAVLADTDLDAVARRVGEAIEGDLRRAHDRLANTANRAERVMQAYKNDWPGPAAELAIQVDFLPDYLAILDSLTADRLPEFEDRFFRLLQSQSRQNIGAVAQTLNNSRREIRERVDPINRSLKQTEFAPGHYLHVRVEDRRLPEVAEFLRGLAEITSGSLEDAFGSNQAGQEREQAERRFVSLQRLLRRLASPEPADRRWREQCLDSRLHVQFLAEVRDADGHAVDYYTGAGGLSGGERQKLVVFCLAAALRYQLARDGADQPAYGLVVLDEAFDKTDPAFTRAGLDVFATFGFQLLLATPLKMLQTLEDYVGGAAVVTNEEGIGSRFEALVFDHEPEERPDTGAWQETLL